ncbi:hypothetical protein CLTEP_13310 [Clostridium tepidiprofundi DSM 19306]|uniref:DUF1232 domain-containing protein n=1 Tax=Clostridium tepidiprofundi DSM 19306 TaxID=1121338 RepID=A0A151B487_9CLOT|nr:YkvA family protein [Clostridium tepidiprofundi]KYH34734.1 hypothetical protein CLTEP_13310 [Clostridium tepidiprofundi DSM 19306]
MNISSVNVEITERDLLTIVDDVFNEYIDLKELSIDNINIGDSLSVQGRYKKGITVSFSAELIINGVDDNIISINIKTIKVAKLYILNSLKNLILKIALKDLNVIGISFKEGNLYIDLNKLSKIIPYVNFEIKKLDTEAHKLKAQVENINYFKDKQVDTLESLKKSSKCGTVKENNIENKYNKYNNVDEENLKDKISTINNEKEQEYKEECIDNIDENINKKEDIYSCLKNKIEESIPEKHKKIAEYALILPDLIALLIRLFKDKRVNIKTKVIVGGILTYLISPIDILPDNIPIIGSIDDIAIAFFALDMIINQVPEQIILENWQGEDDIIRIIKEGIGYISELVGKRRIIKLIRFINF